MSEKSTAAGLFSLSSATLATKVLGYARDALLVAVFGGGALTDTYYAAFRILNLFRRTVGEGAVNAGFIPALEKEKAASGDNGAAFFSAAWTLILVLSLALAALGIIFREELVKLISYGFTARPEQFRLAAIVTALLMPHLVFVNATALFQAALNAAGKFFLPALAPAAFSLVIIGYLFALRAPFAQALSPGVKIMGLAAAATASGLIQAAVLLPMLKKAGYGLNFSNPFKTPAAWRAMIFTAPAAAVMAQDQISLFINTMYASFLAPGSITAIYNAARLIQFPVSLFAAAAAAISLPELARSSAANRTEDFGLALSASFKTTALIIIPAAVGLMTLALPLSRALFEHGQFTYEGSVLTAGVLFYLALGLPAYGVNKLAAAACYGAGDMKTPVKIVLAQTALNAALCYLLMRPLGARGLALATSLSSLAAAVMFMYSLRKRGSLAPGPASFYYKSFASAGVMAAFCLAAKYLLGGFHPAVTAALAVPGGIAVYLIGLKVLGLEERKLITGGKF